MAESSASLAQRVEALEQISHARVVERVGQVEQRVSGIESAREAGEPHTATKADIAHLETIVVESRSSLQQQITNANATTEKRLRELIMWMIGMAIALAGVIVAAVAFIVSRLP